MSRRLRVRWSRLADLDLQGAISYLQERSPGAARRLAIEVQDAVERIREFPELGASTRDLLPQGRYRHWACGRYRLIYRIEDDLLWILRVWDSKQDPDKFQPE